MVRMEYQVKLQYTALSDSDFILNVRPAETPAQRVLHEAFAIDGATHESTFVDPINSNRIDRVHADRGALTIKYQGVVEIAHTVHAPSALVEQRVAALPPSVLPYTLPSRYCPSDKMRHLALAMFGTSTPGYGRVLSICNWVTQHVRFQPGASEATTCAIDTFQSRVGVCRDYAHLMISMCRALNLPARYVTGVDYGADPAMGPTDFHGYVEVFLGQRWYLFDPSGISPVTGLIRIGTGRDAADVPFATLFGDIRFSSPEVNIALLGNSSLLADTGAVDDRYAQATQAVSTANGSQYLPIPQYSRSQVRLSAEDQPADKRRVALQPSWRAKAALQAFVSDQASNAFLNSIGST